MLELLCLAAKKALSNDANDIRNFFLGCIGVRNDGVQIAAKNGAVLSTTVNNYSTIPNAHAEGRALRKMGCGGVMYVARVARKDHSYAMARPCKICQARIRARGIKKVFYTIDNNTYGIWDSQTGRDRIVYC